METPRLGLITGCGKGIGLSCLRLHLESHPFASAIGISRHITPEIITLQEYYKDRLIFYARDLTHYGMINDWLGNTVSSVGVPSFAICNAGIRSRLSIKAAEVADYRRVMEVNAFAHINIIKLLAQLRTDIQIPLRIIVVSSIVGARGFDELSTYATSKAAVEGFVRSASVEMAKSNIHINCLNPGFVSSSYADDFQSNRPELYKWTIDRTPMGRWGECDEIAKLALFLCSSSNSYMTGAMVYADGGWTAQ
jgi:NAD(P)-dependent dehydrogenase (short-subunit alcohol dehydrogenase family)